VLLRLARVLVLELAQEQEKEQVLAQEQGLELELGQALVD
jgi:hypothetical protein